MPPSTTLVVPEGVKVAVSLPDGVFESAGGVRAAEGCVAQRASYASILREHPTRASYASVLREYPREHAGEGITELLDEVYGAEEGAGGPDPVLARLQTGSLPRGGGW